MSRFNPTLEAAIRARPDDPRPWAVYGDWLEAEGDPRGALVGLMLAREDSPTAALAKAVHAFFEANHAWLVGPAEPKSDEALTWRRGFLAAIHCTDPGTLKALLAHPSARFLAHVGLAPSTNVGIDAWVAALEGHRFPSAMVGQGALIETVLAWPQLQRATVCLPYGDLPAYAWHTAKHLTWLRLVRATGEALEPLLTRPPPALTELRLSDCDESVLEMLVRHDLSHLAVVTADGEHSADALDALADATRPRKLVLRMNADAQATLRAELPAVVTYVDEPELESALVVLGVPSLPADARTLLERLAQKSGSSQLAAFIAPAQLAGRPVTVLRFHGDDAAGALLPVALAHELNKALKVRTAAVTLSGSNDVARALCFSTGSEPAPPQKDKRARPRVEMAAAHKLEASLHGAGAIVRDVLSRLFGVDPGPDALDDLLRAIEEASPVTLHGTRFAPGAPLLTTDPASDAPEDVDGEDEDAEEQEAWEFEEDLANSPDVPEPELEEEPDHEPSRIDVPLVAVAAPVADEDEDEAEEEEEDPDAHVPDLVDADEGEIWNEGPVDAPEEWTIPEDPPPPSEPDPEQLTAEQAEPAILPSCVRCATPAETTQCRLCFDELCEACLPLGERRVCSQCVPI